MDQYRIELRHFDSLKTVDIMANDHADAKQRADRQFSGWVVLSTEFVAYGWVVLSAEFVE